MPRRAAAAAAAVVVAAGMFAVYSEEVGRWRLGVRGRAGVAASGAESSRPAAGQRQMQMQSRRAVVGVAWRDEVNNGGR